VFESYYDTCDYDTTLNQRKQPEIILRPSTQAAETSSRCNLPTSAWCLLPVARDPHPAARSVHPLTPNPHGSCSRRRNPTARYPHIVSSGPAPVAWRPDISRAGDRRLRFNANCWGSPGHHDLPGRTRRRNLLRSCRRCHSSWFLSAADEEKWGKRQYINNSSHISLLAMDSFRTRNSALFELAIDDFFSTHKR
jgi:hypothetical protein